MQTMEILTLALGAAWASGINLYAIILLLGGLGLFGIVDLPPGLEGAALIGLCLFAWLAPKLWRGIRGFFNRFSNPAEAARHARQREWTSPGTNMVHRGGNNSGDIDASF